MLSTIRCDGTKFAVRFARVVGVRSRPRREVDQRQSEAGAPCGDFGVVPLVGGNPVAHIAPAHAKGLDGPQVRFEVARERVAVSATSGPACSSRNTAGVCRNAARRSGRRPRCARPAARTPESRRKSPVRKNDARAPRRASSSEDDRSSFGELVARELERDPAAGRRAANDAAVAERRRCAGVQKRQGRRAAQGRQRGCAHARPRRHRRRPSDPRAALAGGSLRSRCWSSHDDGSSSDSRCVNTVTFGTTVRIRASRSSSSSWPRCTVHSPGTST